MEGAGGVLPRHAEGLRVAIIGAGPAGTMSALALLHEANRLSRDVEVVLFDHKVFSEFGPPGCNLCAGVISDTLIRSLRGLGVAIPQAVIQREIKGYEMVARTGSIRLLRPPHSTIYTVYRGMGPWGLEYEERSFDAFLLKSAMNAGAVHVNRMVTDLSLPSCPTDPLVVECAGGGTYQADVVIGAFGVNTKLSRRFEALGFGYQAPRTVHACQAEIPLDDAFIQEHYNGWIKIFNLGIPRIRFASIIPKRRHVTVSIVGKRVRREDLEGFLGHPKVLESFPVSWTPPGRFCHCSPHLPVTEARNPFCDRLVIIGDADISRYLKDGIGSAFFTGCLAAETIMAFGASREDFKRNYYRGSRRCYRLDNLMGKALFFSNDLISRAPWLASAFLRVTLWEQEHLPAGRRPLNEFLWCMFTGDAPYLQTARKGLSPMLWERLFVEVGRGLRERFGRSWAPARWDR